MKYYSILLLSIICSCASYKKENYFTTVDDYLYELQYLHKSGYKILLNNTEIDIEKTFVDKRNIDSIVLNQNNRTIGLMHKQNKVTFITLSNLLSRHHISLNDSISKALVIINGIPQISNQNELETYQVEESNIEQLTASTKSFSIGCRNYSYIFQLELNN